MTDGQPGTQVKLGWPDDPLWPQGGYANMVLVNHTPWDFTIRFGHATLPAIGEEDAPSGPVEVVAAPVAQVTLPPVALLQLVHILQDQIAKYNANFGEIGGPPLQPPS